MNNEVQIKMAAKIYKCRTTATDLFREEYEQRIDPYIKILKGVMKENNETEIKAVLRLSNEAPFVGNGMAEMMLMAAMVEIIEPSKK